MVCSFLLIFIDFFFFFFFQGVNVIRCAASFETIQRYWSNDLTTTKIKDIMTSCDPNILVKLATRLGESKVRIFISLFFVCFVSSFIQPSF